jgi:hypothetical protein
MTPQTKIRKAVKTIAEFCNLTIVEVREAKRKLKGIDCSKCMNFQRLLNEDCPGCSLGSEFERR